MGMRYWLNKAVTIVLVVATCIVLTVLTQVGGLIFIISRAFYKWIGLYPNQSIPQWLGKTLAFCILYLIAIFFIIPRLAVFSGRVPMPVMAKHHVRPLTIWTCLLNRNYVRPEMREITFRVAEEMNRRYSGTVVNYLDAGFPFFNKCPLPPHLSHLVGMMLDVAFFYKNKATGLPSDEALTPFGYGGSEPPQGNEPDRPLYCEKKGYWQYSLMYKILPQHKKAVLSFDAERTRTMVNLFAAQPGIGKILIEPHIKMRLKLVSRKIRLHGCQAVRHDDHVHVQLH